MNSNSELEKQFENIRPGDFGIFGDPIEHSLSPKMQEPALAWWWKKSNHKSPAPRYHKIRVKTSELAAALDLAKKAGMKGLNITVPHKEAAYEIAGGKNLFDQTVKSVNTLSIEKGQWAGTNTDGFGFLESLSRDLEFTPNGKKVLVLGAGGTGRTVVQQLLSQKANLYWWNRTPARIEKLKLVTGLSRDSMKKVFPECDLIVNTTSVGLKEGDASLDVPPFRSGQCVLDVIYNRETEFMINAKKAGAKVMGGLGMLLYQGAAAFEIWTGAKAPVKLMRDHLIQAAKEKGLKTIWPSDI